MSRPQTSHHLRAVGIEDERAADEAVFVNGEPVERYDPSRDDILLLLGKANPAVRANLEEAGWELRGDDGRRELWGRDRIAAAQATATRPRAPEPPGLDVA
jgi:hypothetical protein